MHIVVVGLGFSHVLQMNHVLKVLNDNAQHFAQKEKIMHHMNQINLGIINEIDKFGHLNLKN